MSILSLQQLFTGEIFPAICRTLAHSLWEGMLLAVTAAVILLLTRRSAAAIRYNLLAAAYLLFIVAIAITFYLQFEHVTSNALSVTSLTVSNEGKYILSSIDPQLNTTPTIGAIILNFIDRNSNSIMLIWCCFIFFK
ncbi:MAG TPA: hypothetical protein VKH37_03210, partial [Ferruginibacter sp.]|nr:hypothetical protein [Ferruginibacter sp.]